MKRLLTICVLCFIFLSTVVGATFVREDVLDDFGDPTGEFRVVTEKKLSGTYKSPSTSNGKCNYSVILTPDSNAVTFVIEENGKDQDLSTAWWTDETYTVKVKEEKLMAPSIISREQTSQALRRWQMPCVRKASNSSGLRGRFFLP